MLATRTSPRTPQPCFSKRNANIKTIRSKSISRKKLHIRRILLRKKRYIQQHKSISGPLKGKESARGSVGEAVVRSLVELSEAFIHELLTQRDDAVKSTIASVSLLQSRPVSEIAKPNADTRRFRRSSDRCLFLTQCVVSLKTTLQPSSLDP